MHHISPSYFTSKTVAINVGDRAESATVILKFDVNKRVCVNRPSAIKQTGGLTRELCTFHLFHVRVAYRREYIECVITRSKITETGLCISRYVNRNVAADSVRREFLMRQNVNRDKNTIHVLISYMVTKIRYFFLLFILFVVRNINKK